MIEIHHRSHRPAWRHVTSARTLDLANDELASQSAMRLSHGDLVRVVASADHRRRVTPRLYVADVSDGGVTLRPVPADVLTWDDATDAEAMLRRCERVDRRRVAMAACDIARSVIHLVPQGEDRPRIAIETAERVCRGEARAKGAEAWEAAAEAARETREARESAMAATKAAATEAARAGASATEAARAETVWLAVAWAMSAARAARAAASPHGLAALVRRRIPATVLACALCRLRDPLPVDVTPWDGERE